jgi:lysine-N-methylase
VSLPLPYRPRLADHVSVRRHVWGGHDHVVIEARGGGGLVRIDAATWDVLRHADGTRDADGVLLAASRQGAYLSAAKWLELLELLLGAGMLADGIRSRRPRPAAPPTPPDRPLVPLPGYGLCCDGSGGCCSQYSSILFAPADAERARVLLPQVLEAGARAFVPEQGSASAGHAVALVDGHCAYLREDGLCGIHAAAGMRAKPLRCQLFPATFVDDGVVVRVSTAIECSCVLASVGKTGGDPLIPPEARTVADLEPGTPVRALPVEVPLTAHAQAAREDAAAWSSALFTEEPPAGVDVAASFWALGDAVERAGLDAAAAAAAINAPAPLDPRWLAPWIEALAGRVEIGVTANAAYKSPADRSRLIVSFIADTLAGLRTPGAVADLCATAAADPAGERFYLRAALHGHHLLGDRPLAAALRDRAVRLLVARALPRAVAAVRPGDVATRYPLCAVEVALRAHGLHRYERDVKAG